MKLKVGGVGGACEPARGAPSPFLPSSSSSVFVILVHGSAIKRLPAPGGEGGGGGTNVGQFIASRETHGLNTGKQGVFSKRSSHDTN